MNRIQAVESAFDSRFTSAPQDVPPLDARPDAFLKHQFFIPLHYEKNYAYPLVIWLHGPGGCEQEINQVLPHMSVRNYVGSALCGSTSFEQDDAYGNPTYTWDQSAASIERGAEDLMAIVELAQSRFNIADHRIFLAGYDVGGTMALRLALQWPNLVSGVLSLGGAMPHTDTPLRRLSEARSLPVLLSHCRDSEVYDHAHVCRDLRLLHAAGMSVALRQYPCPQEVTTQMLADADAWIMEQVCGQPERSVVRDDPTHLRLEEHN